MIIMTDSPTIDDLVKLGISASFSGKTELALHAYTKALSLHDTLQPNNEKGQIHILQGLGQVLIKLGRHAEATHVLEKALALSIRLAPYMRPIIERTLGLAYLGSGRSEEGKQLFNRANASLLSDLLGDSSNSDRPSTS
ncbi:MAG: tetratricopeptide repeat protein [Nitrospira sp.]|nr:tetratricopeptide repeat protein [Nitrospira sp.]